MDPKVKMMAVTPLLLLLVAVLLSATSGAAYFIPAPPVCNPVMYRDDDPYAGSVSRVLDLVIDDAQTILDRNAIQSADGTVHAHAICEGSSTQGDCAGCLGHARQVLEGACGNSVGASVTLEHCRLRYENYFFDY